MCEKLPSISSKYVTERECQKCRELTDVEMVEGRKLYCDPVQDETCSTTYPAQCQYTTHCSTHHCQDNRYWLV